MGSDKIFMFDNPAAGESAGIMSMIPALLQNKGLDPNMVAALMSNKNNQDAWGGAGCWWIWIILLFFLWGGNGFGNGFGNGANGIPAQLNNEAGRELLMNAIQGNGTAINQLASSLSCSTQQLQNAICQIQYAVSKMKDRNGNKIHPYDKDQVEALMKQFNVELKNDVEYNKVYVLNMVRADYMGSSIVNEQYACMFVKDYLDDVDGSPTRALDEYYAKCIACGTPFSWEDYI